jgi:hypothetical protein
VGAESKPTPKSTSESKPSAKPTSAPKPVKPDLGI